MNSFCCVDYHNYNCGVQMIYLIVISIFFTSRFSSGALDIYQCFLVRVHNCNFANSGEDGVLKPDYQYRGHAGGLSIGNNNFKVQPCYVYY